MFAAGVSTKSHSQVRELRAPHQAVDHSIHSGIVAKFDLNVGLIRAELTSKNALSDPTTHCV